MQESWDEEGTIPAVYCMMRTVDFVHESQFNKETGTFFGELRELEFGLGPLSAYDENMRLTLRK